MKKHIQELYHPISYVYSLFGIIFGLGSVILPIAGSTQNFIKEWSVQSESDLWDLASDFAIGDSNNIFLAGNFGGKSILKSSDSRKAKNGKNKQVELQNKQSIFIAKYSQDGVLDWVRQFKNKGYTYISAINVSGNTIYITGYFEEELDFENIKLNANYKITAFIAELDLKGEIIWAKSIPGEFVGQKIFVVPLKDKKVFLAGTFRRTVSLKDTISIMNNFGTHIFGALLDSNGIIVHNLFSNGNGNSILTDVVADKKSHLFLGGSFDNNISISNKNLKTVGKNDGFIYCLTPEFEPLYTKQIGSIYEDEILGLASDKGNILVSGFYSESISTLAIKLPQVVGNKDVFVVKLDGFGNTIWADGFGSTANDYPTSIGVNYSSKVFVSGSTRGRIKKEKLKNPSGLAGDKLFIAKYSEDGDLKLIDTLNLNRINFNRKIKIDNEGYLVLSGNFHKELNLENKTTKLNSDNFHLTKLFDCDSQKTIQLPDDTIFCGTSISLVADSSFIEYSWNTGYQANQITIDSSGLYILKAKDKFGCISKDSIRVTINKLPEFTLGDTIYLVANMPLTLFGPENMLEYLWSNKSTLPYYYLPENTNYPTEVSLKVKDQNGCEALNIAKLYFKSTTKQKDVVINSTINSGEFNVEIYPNPFNSIVNVDISNINTSESTNLQVFSPDGKLVLNQNLSPISRIMHHTLYLKSFANSNYIFKLTNGNEVIEKVIIKQ